jgi:hypothetical protein
VPEPADQRTSGRPALASTGRSTPPPAPPPARPLPHLGELDLFFLSPRLLDPSGITCLHQELTSSSGGETETGDGGRREGEEPAEAEAEGRRPLQEARGSSKERPWRHRTRNWPVALGEGALAGCASAWELPQSIIRRTDALLHFWLLGGLWVGVDYSRFQHEMSR